MKHLALKSQKQSTAIDAKKNRAVYQQRTSSREGDEFFPTPPWATRAFFEHVAPQLNDVEISGVAKDPCCGAGHMAKILAHYGLGVVSTDLFDHGFGEAGIDFLEHNLRDEMGYDWVFANPPFKLSLPFIEKALKVANVGVAMLVRTSFMEGQSRYNKLFAENPPAVVAQFTERVMFNYGQVKTDSNLPATYCWMVWLKEPNHEDSVTRMIWIRPCRKSLELESDYDEIAKGYRFKQPLAHVFPLDMPVEAVKERLANNKNQQSQKEDPDWLRRLEYYEANPHDVDWKTDPHKSVRLAYYRKYPNDLSGKTDPYWLIRLVGYRAHNDSGWKTDSDWRVRLGYYEEHLYDDDFKNDPDHDVRSAYYEAHPNDLDWKTDPDWRVRLAGYRAHSDLCWKTDPDYEANPNNLDWKNDPSEHARLEYYKLHTNDQDWKNDPLVVLLKEAEKETELQEGAAS